MKTIRQLGASALLAVTIVLSALPVFAANNESGTKGSRTGGTTEAIELANSHPTKGAGGCGGRCRDKSLIKAEAPVEFDTSADVSRSGAFGGRRKNRLFEDGTTSSKVVSQLPSELDTSADVSRSGAFSGRFRRTRSLIETNAENSREGVPGRRLGGGTRLTDTDQAKTQIDRRDRRGTLAKNQCLGDGRGKIKFVESKNSVGVA